MPAESMIRPVAFSIERHITFGYFNFFNAKTIRGSMNVAWKQGRTHGVRQRPRGSRSPTRYTGAAGEQTRFDDEKIKKRKKSTAFQ